MTTRRCRFTHEGAGTRDGHRARAFTILQPSAATLTIVEPVLPARGLLNGLSLAVASWYALWLAFV